MIAHECKALGPIVDRLLGRPFRPLAHGPEAYYCLGLVCEIIREATGIEVEDPFVVQVTEDTLLGFRRRFLELPCVADLRPLDVLYSRREGDAHLAVVENDRWAVSVHEDLGVCRDPLREEIRVAVSAHRLKELL